MTKWAPKLRTSASQKAMSSPWVTCNDFHRASPFPVPGLSSTTTSPSITLPSSHPSDNDSNHDPVANAGGSSPQHGGIAGAVRNIPVDLRIISACNQDLERLVEEKSFRQDLFYRLAVATIVMPPLRERRGDVPLLIDHFLAKFNQVKNNELDEGPLPQARVDVLAKATSGYCEDG